jgi:hypothetical protein
MKEKKEKPPPPPPPSTLTTSSFLFFSFIYYCPIHWMGIWDGVPFFFILEPFYLVFTFFSLLLLAYIVLNTQTLDTMAHIEKGASKGFSITHWHLCAQKVQKLN